MGCSGGAKSVSSKRRDLSVIDSKNRAIPGAAKCFKMRIIEEAAWTLLGSSGCLDFISASSSRL